MVYHRILNIVLCYTLGPCCLCTLQLISVNLKLPTPCLPQPSPPWQLPVCSVSDCFVDRLICVIFYTPYISDTIWYLPFSFLFTSLSMIISSCIHVGANGIISFFYGWVIFHCVCVYIYTHTHHIFFLIQDLEFLKNNFIYFWLCWFFIIV